MSSSSSSVLVEDEKLDSFYFEVYSSGDFGRYLVAKEDISERTLILTETPIVFGPTDDKDLENNIVFLFCLACCKQLFPYEGVYEKEGSEDECENSGGSVSGSGSSRSSSRGSFSLYYCSKCGWPLCDVQCEKAPIHSDLECRFFTFLFPQRSIYPPPQMWLMYKSVIILRLLLLIQRDPVYVWKEFLERLEHHTETREAKENCVRADDIVLENIEYFTEGLEEKIRSSKKKNSKRWYNLPYHNDRVTLKRIIGTLNVNSFCANNNENKRIARCMFKTASLFAHSCAPNCSWTIQIPKPEDINSSGKGRRRKRKNGMVLKRKPVASFKSPPEIQIYTSIRIQKGDIVTIPYSTRNIFYGTLKRQICMESVGHFICKCKRCMDPSELGTYMSSIRCFKCEMGFLVPVDPSDEESQWICSNSFNASENETGCGNTHPAGNDGDDDDDDDDEANNPRHCCSSKCSVGKVVYFTSKIQDKIDRVRAKELDWIEEQDALQNLYDIYYDKELHKNHYLLFEISTRMVELLDEKLVTSDGTAAELGVLGITGTKREELVGRFLFHVKYMMNIADTILPGYNHYQDQIRMYLEEAESLKMELGRRTQDVE